MDFHDFTTCPYNKSHRVQKRRMQYHLVKCAKQHPEVVLEICPYNATHRMVPHELEKHIEDCPARFMYEEQCISFTPQVYDFEIDDEVYEKIMKERSLVTNYSAQKGVNFANEKKIRPPKTCPRALSVCGLSPNVVPNPCRQISLE